MAAGVIMYGYPKLAYLARVLYKLPRILTYSLINKKDYVRLGV
ncbi:hypothetical protein NMYAN_120057 [Nitrosomonas nitrosa]|uniref:Uncharacterized protein n=1 Tax=Nitrosomonas nitrosa TaxID=52442 RepID=A0A8H8YXR5_9PROT|nr:hypothetical protein NMYAN_120057 [Nitrosomonas nitrosa]